MKFKTHVVVMIGVLVNGSLIGGNTSDDVEEIIKNYDEMIHEKRRDYNIEDIEDLTARVDEVLHKNDKETKESLRHITDGEYVKEHAKLQGLKLNIIKKLVSPYISSPQLKFPFTTDSGEKKDIPFCFQERFESFLKCIIDENWDDAVQYIDPEILNSENAANKLTYWAWEMSRFQRARNSTCDIKFIQTGVVRNHGPGNYVRINGEPVTSIYNVLYCIYLVPSKVGGENPIFRSRPTSQNFIDHWSLIKNEKNQYQWYVTPMEFLVIGKSPYSFSAPMVNGARVDYSTFFHKALK